MSATYELIIIGAGPAGLTAGIYAKRAGLDVLVIEDPSLPSQALSATQIENYPGFPQGISGRELIERFRKQAEGIGVEFKKGKVYNLTLLSSQRWEVESEEGKARGIALIIASGAHPKELGVKGERELKGKGVSYCAICDGNFFREQEIVVVGGGNSALEASLFLSKIVKKIVLVHRRDELRGVKVLQKRVFANRKISVCWNSIVEEILGEDRVEGVRVFNLRSGEKQIIPCAGVFIQVGSVPNTEFVKDVVERDKEGYIITDEKMCASREGIFASGDCRSTALRQVITACGDGALAVVSAQQYIHQQRS
ncbi:MAG: thioredoxin-disulfide reductase [Candidatus Omnitrophota bacterium]|nr:MAG: thioredoxin-disulfide reductase [Candidatus Omnitrophota bacterium]